MFTVKRFLALFVMAGMIGVMPGVVFADGEAQPVDAPLSREFLDFNPGGNSGIEIVGDTGSASEFQGGYIPSPVDLSHLENNPPVRKKTSTQGGPEILGETSIPSKYDIREHGGVPSVRNQGSFGTCWAHAAIGGVESNYLMKNGTYLAGDEPDLSELHLAWFVYKDPAEGHAFSTREGNFSGGPVFGLGGNADQAIAFMSRFSGPTLESELPYTSIDKTLAVMQAVVGDKHPESYDFSVRLHDAYTLGNMTEALRDTVKELVMNNGAVQISYYSAQTVADSSSESGKSSPYYQTSSDCYSYYYSGTNDTNHAVLIVGWDDNFSKGNFHPDSQPSIDGAWLIRNSWGTDTKTAYEGYFWMSYAQNIKNVTAYVGEAPTGGMKTYYHDALGNCGRFGYGATNGVYISWAANVFKVEDSNEMLSQVSFVTTDNNASYDVYVFRLGTETPTSPVKDSSAYSAHISGGMTYAGYHVVSLPEAVKLSKDEYFSVALRMKTLNGINIATERYTDYSGELGNYSNPIINAGESYFSGNTSETAPTSWVDGYNGITFPSDDVPTPMNACIKAFTIQDPEATFTFDSAEFPDANLLSYLTTQYGASISLGRLAEITSLDLSSLDIADLTGITYFTGLQYLNISGNASLNIIDVTSLDKLDLKNIITDPGVNILNGTDAGKILFGQHSLILSGKIGLDFYVSLSNDVKSSDVQVFFSANGKTISSPLVSEGESTDYGYLLSCGVQSIQMAEEITATANYSNSTVTQKYRVSDYIGKLLENLGDTKSPDLVALANAIKDYGHYVQPVLAAANDWEYGVKYKTMDYATESASMTITDEESTALNKFALSYDKTASYTLSLDLELDTDTALNLYIRPLNGITISGVTCTSTDAINNADGVYTVSIPGISAHRLGDMATINITIGSTIYPLKASALSYACRVMENASAVTDGSFDDLKRAVLALYRYYTATIDYRKSLN